MSDYHVLEQSADKKTVRVALHYTIPADSQNQVNQNHRNLIAIVRKNAESGTVKSQVPYLADEFSTELAKMQTGEIIEEVVTVRFSSLGLSNAQKKAEIEAAWEAKRAEIFDRLQTQLEYYHYDNDIV